MPGDLFGFSAATPQPVTLPSHGLSVDAKNVAMASALLWTFRTQTELFNLLTKLGVPAAGGKRFTAVAVKAALSERKLKGFLVEEANRPGHFHLLDTLCSALPRVAGWAGWQKSSARDCRF